MSKRIKLTERELTNLINRVISEKELNASKRYRDDTCMCWWSDGTRNSVMCEGKGGSCGTLTEGVECDACCIENGMTSYNPTTTQSPNYTISEGTNRVLREDFEISGDEPATKTDLNNAVKHIISKLRDAVDVGSYADYVK